MNRFASRDIKVALYSPPQINKRSPEKEPRPRQVNPMTIAAGFRCHDGVVVCTDSENTVGQAKFYEAKIFEATARNAGMYIAGAGNQTYIRTIAEEMASDVQGKNMDFDSIEALAQKRVMEVYSRYFIPARQAGDPDAPSMALLLAAQIKGLGTKLYRIEETGGICPIDSGLAVVGTQAAESLVRNLASIFFLGYITSVSAMYAIARHLISQAVKFASYCGGSAQVVCLTDSGKRWVDVLPSADPSPDPLVDIFDRIPFVLEACAKGNQDELQRLLGELQVGFQKIMDTRKEQQGQYQLPETREWVW